MQPSLLFSSKHIPESIGLAHQMVTSPNVKHEINDLSEIYRKSANVMNSPFQFICLLGVLALLGDIYCFYLFFVRKAPVRMAILRILDLITVVVPPALPAAMTIGTVYSQGSFQFCLVYD